MRKAAFTFCVVASLLGTTSSNSARAQVTPENQYMQMGSFAALSEKCLGSKRIPTALNEALSTVIKTKPNIAPLMESLVSKYNDAYDESLSSMKAYIASKGAWASKPFDCGNEEDTSIIKNSENTIVAGFSQSTEESMEQDLAVFDIIVKEADKFRAKNKSNLEIIKDMTRSDPESNAMRSSIFSLILDQVDEWRNFKEFVISNSAKIHNKRISDKLKTLAVNGEQAIQKRVKLIKKNLEKSLVSDVPNIENYVKNIMGLREEADGFAVLMALQKLCVKPEELPEKFKSMCEYSQ